MREGGKQRGRKSKGRERRERQTSRDWGGEEKKMARETRGREVQRNGQIEGGKGPDPLSDSVVRSYQ